MNFKNRAGFTLLEVMIATAIMGLMFVSIFALQSTVTRSVIWATRRFERALHAHNFFISSVAQLKENEQEVVRDKKIPRPSTNLQFKQTKIDSDEPFGTLVKNLYKQQVTILWDDTHKQQTNIVGYAYRPRKNSSVQNKSAVTGASQ